MEIVYYKKKRYYVEIGENNTTIYNSYLIKDRSDMKKFLNHIRCRFYPKGSINKRHNKDMIREWRVHNLLYSWKLFTKHTKDVDLDYPQSLGMKVLYFILSPLYLHYK